VKCFCLSELTCVKCTLSFRSQLLDNETLPVILWSDTGIVMEFYRVIYFNLYGGREYVTATCESISEIVWSTGIYHDCVDVQGDFTLANRRTFNLLPRSKTIYSDAGTFLKQRLITRKYHHVGQWFSNILPLSPPSPDKRKYSQARLFF
jgi:hypothetical protein